MIKTLQIEWLKSKRTKAFFLAVLTVCFGVLWQMIIVGHLSNNILANLLNNQTTDAIILPIITMLFTNRIVKNEHEGLTLKLQAANGFDVLHLFHAKLIFSLSFFAFLAALEIILFSLYTIFQGGQLWLTPLILKWFGLVISYTIFTIIDLILNFYCQKQGIILGLGFLGSFLGLVCEASSSQLWTGIFPWQTSAFLSPYQYHFIGEKAGKSIVENTVMPDLEWRFAISLLLGILLYLSTLCIIKRKRSL